MTDNKWWPERQEDEPKWFEPDQGPTPENRLYVMQYDKDGNPLGFINIYGKEVIKENISDD